MKMKKRTIAIFTLLAAVWCAGCGSVFNDAIDDITLRQTSWFTFLGGTENDGAHSVKQTSDGGYIVAGRAQADISPLQGKTPLNPHDPGINEDMLVVKLDAGGNVAWYTFLGGGQHDRANSVQQASDGGYIVAGYAKADIPTLQGKTPLNPFITNGTNGNMLVVKLDAGGFVAWYTFLGGMGDDIINSFQQTSDGGYIVAGHASQTIATGNMQNAPCRNTYSAGYDMLVVKLDSGGNVAWYTFLGGAGSDYTQSVQQTSEGGYIVAGQASSAIDPLQGKSPLNPHDPGSNEDMLVVKLDSGGNVAWYTFLGGTGEDSAQSVQQTSDGGYIVAGYADVTIDPDRMQNAPCLNAHHSSGVGYDMLVVKLDSGGNVAWYIFLGGTDNDAAFSVQQTAEGGYIVAGYGTDIASNQMQNAPCLNNFTTGISGDMLVVKLDSSGNVSWYTFLGGTNDDQAKSVQQTSDGGYIVAGQSASDLSLFQGKDPLNPHSVSYDMLVIKLKNNGRL